MYEKDYNEPLWSTAEELNRNECFNDLASVSYTHLTLPTSDLV